MGDLAVQIRQLASRSDRCSSDDMASELRRTASAVAELEACVAELEARATLAQSYELTINRLCNIAEMWIDRCGGRYSNESPSDVAASAHRVRAYLGETRRAVLMPTDLTKDTKPTLSDCLVAAERKAEQAWAAVSEIAKHSSRCVGVSKVNTTGHDDPVTVRIARGFATQIAGPLTCALYLPSGPANPEHLERHATLLIEAGEEMLKRYQAERVAADAKAAP